MYRVNIIYITVIFGRPQKYNKISNCLIALRDLYLHINLQIKISNNNFTENVCK